jgi:hypothetical protein
MNRLWALLLFFAWAWVLPATVAAAVIVGLVATLSLAGRWPWFVWLLISPSLYLCWLILFLSFSALSIGRIGKRNPKPRYASIPGSERKLMIVRLCGLRRTMISTLPLAGILQHISGTRKLLLRAFSPSVHIGKGVQIFGIVADPDLIEIGDFTIIGGGAAISGHLWTILPNGKRVYVSAPVKIGARVLVGGGALVLCGCSIGDDAIIEPHSYLEPHTQVAAGEIWSGSPAIFRAKRTRFQETRAISNSTD